MQIIMKNSRAVKKFILSYTATSGTKTSCAARQSAYIAKHGLEQIR